jgi:hypothetical protein
MDVPPSVEAAARILSSMQSVPCALDHSAKEAEFCDADFFTEDGTVDREAIPEHHGILRVFRRGSKVVRKTAGVDGVRGLRFFNESSAGLAPLTFGAEPAATALG